MPLRRMAPRRRVDRQAAHGAAESVAQVGGRRGSGHEPGAMVGRGVGIDDGVMETADIGHHRDGPVSHRLHLGQTGGLEAAGHQEEVAPGEDAMGQ